MIDVKKIKLKDFEIGGDKLTILAGPCAIESYECMATVAEKLKTVCSNLGINYVFKSSYDKANRSTIDGYRGLGIDKGLEYLAKIKKEFDLPIVTDVHLPQDAQKVTDSGNENILFTERGVTFGYNNLVTDMRAIPMMQMLGYPVVFDATHSVQMPGTNGCATGGDRRWVPVLAKSAVAAGVNSLFFEVHPEPEQALCDGDNMLPLDKAEHLFKVCKDIFDIVRAED